jgi:hypothetical protein
MILFLFFMFKILFMKIVLQYRQMKTFMYDSKAREKEMVFQRPNPTYLLEMKPSLNSFGQ